MDNIVAPKKSILQIIMRILSAEVQTSLWQQQRSRVIKLSLIPVWLTAKRKLEVVSEFQMQKASIKLAPDLRSITRWSRKEIKSLNAKKIIKKHNHFLCHALEKGNLQIRGKNKVGKRVHYQVYCNPRVISVLQKTKILLKAENPNHQHLLHIQVLTQRCLKYSQVYL